MKVNRRKTEYDNDTVRWQGKEDAKLYKVMESAEEK